LKKIDRRKKEYRGTVKEAREFIKYYSSRIYKSLKGGQGGDMLAWKAYSIISDFMNILGEDCPDAYDLGRRREEYYKEKNKGR
jgi:hypothetical protein